MRNCNDKDASPDPQYVSDNYIRFSEHHHWLTSVQRSCDDHYPLGFPKGLHQIDSNYEQGMVYLTHVILLPVM